MDDTSRHRDPIAARIRDLRLGSSTSLRALAHRVSEHLATRIRTGASPRTERNAVSPSYLSLIENGRKVPDLAIATAIGEALGDDPALYSAWIAVRKRADVATAIAAAQTLARALERSGSSSGVDPLHDPRGRATATTSSPRDEALSAPRGARLRVPLIREHDDPGDALRPACPVIDWLRVDLAELPGSVRERLARPVAWRVEADAAHVSTRIERGGFALLVRDLLPLDRREAYAVRSPGGVVVRHLLWDGRRLVLLPPPDAHGFEIVEAAGEDALRSIVVGRAVPIHV